MKAAGPIDGDVALLSVESRGTFHTSTSTDAAEFEEPIEDRAIITNIELSLFPLEVVHVLGTNLLEEVDVFVCMELRHL